MTPHEKVVFLIESAKKAAKHTVRYYNSAGEELTTIRDMIECLNDEGKITTITVARTSGNT